MSEKLDKLFKELKDGHMISLYRNRVMFYESGFGEIQFWNLTENEDTGDFVLGNSGVSINFKEYKITKSESGAYTSFDAMNGETVIASFKFPTENKIAQNHNTFYVEEFTLKMEDVLRVNSIEKGDWANKLSQLKTLVDGVKDNLSKVKTTLPNEEVAKSCIDIANYAMMLYYKFNQKEERE